MPEVTVAVPVKDRREQMLRCLDALLAQTHPSFEILVLDNESSDGTPEACLERARGAGVSVRVEVVPGTVGHVRNRAGELARGELLAFTDSDCIPDPGWLAAGAAALEADPSLGAIQGRTLPEVVPVQGWPATITVEGYTGRFESCNVVLRTRAFRESAGFDEEVGHFWEDTAAGFALLRDGWKIGYAPDALVHHDVTYPGFAWHLKRQQKQANVFPVLAKYPEMRRELFTLWIFNTPGSARFNGLLAGLLLARAHRAALLLAAPYVVNRVKREYRFALREGWSDPKVFAQHLAHDGAHWWALAKGSLKHRRIVL